jgi:hypothetical protein
MIKATSKSQDGALSILRNTNIAYSVGDSMFVGLGKGVLIQLEGHEAFVHISSVTRQDLSFRFSRVNQQKVSVRGDTGAKLSVSDCVEISIPAFEALGLSELIERGSGYTKGDLLIVQNGSPSKNVRDNKLNNAAFEVIDTDENGGIKRIRVKEKGEYYVAPAEDCELSGGSGKGARISIDFEEKAEKKFEERQIIKVERTPAFTFIEFDAPFNSLIKEGQIMAKKWKMTLSSNYPSDNDGIQIKYNCIKNFTPKLGLPLIPPNSPSAIPLYNNTVLQLDQQLSDMKDEIKWLKEKILG